METMTVGTFLRRFDAACEAVTVKEDASLKAVLEAMLRHGEERSVFVVDETGALKGEISLGVLARHFVHEEIAPQTGFSPSTEILHYLTAETARDIMHADVVSTTMDEPLETAAKKMLGSRVYKLLPVLDTSGRIVAVLSLVNLLESLQDS